MNARARRFDIAEIDAPDHVIFGQTIRLECGQGSLATARHLRDLQVIYEPFLASRVIPTKGLCLDLGAGAGWFGLPFALAFKDWTVICVEPDPDQFAVLQRNARRLGLRNVICLQASVHPEGHDCGDDAKAVLNGKLRTRPATFQPLLALPGKLAPMTADTDAAEGTLSCPALPPGLISRLAPDLVRIDAPGCEAAIAGALKNIPAGFVVGRTYPYLPSDLFIPSPAAGPRQFYLVHGEHVLRRDYEDNFATRRPGLDVIVAMYNTRAFIEDCVDSVLADGNPAIRVLVVDDGSTDDCAAHVAALYRGNPRVRLLRKANGGCASARNFGRRHSDASHIAFIDADDRVDAGMFTALLETARYTGAFVVEGDFKTFTTGPDGIDRFSPSYEAGLYQTAGNHGLAEFDYDWISGSDMIIGQPSIWRRVHRRDFLDRRNIWFPEHVRAFDDQQFQILVCQHAGAIAHVRGHAYHYRQHPGQDIKQGDERHFYSFNMFRAVFLRALDEGRLDLGPVFQSLLNTMSWSYRSLSADLQHIYQEAAVEFLAVIDRTFGPVMTPQMLGAVGIPGLEYLMRRRIQQMGSPPVSYATMRLESWRWQPEFIRMMQSVK